MNLHSVTIALLLFCFLKATNDDVDGNPAHFIDDVSINCGSTGTSAARDRKEWHGDVLSKFSSLFQMKGSSTASIAITRKPVSADDPVPYGTARLSRSPFSYSLTLNPGQKILRFHFNPILYKGYKRYKDFFNVEAGRFTLLSNFSASVTAYALGVNFFVKEYCLNIEENQEIKMIFSPASSQSFDTYGFVNGIEIISVPASLSYFQGGGDIGVQVVGKSLVYVDNSTALEVIRRLNLKQDSISKPGGFQDRFGMWETASKQKAVKVNNITWKTSVDVGFRYLVRLHFSEVKLKIADNNGVTFEVCINDMISSFNLDVVRERDDLRYRDYMVMMTGQKEEGKRDLLICLKSNEEFMDGYGPLEGFEIMKLSNSDNSLANPNPLPSIPDSSYWTILNLYQVLGHKNMIATVAITSLALINIIAYTLREIWEARGAKEKNMPPIKVGRLCRRYSLAEIQLATGNFNHEHLLGRGGFGNVYKGLIGKGQETVAIKRLKSNSRQGMQEFLTEVETLSQLRHVNLVTLVGYCNENGELILVYEYMARGTLSDHIFRDTSNNDNHSPLTWRQRLVICIGAGRGLEYLHTGNSIIHRDVKASNILLDENFKAKVSDFGLAKHSSFSKLDSHVSTKVKGTFGYFDPSYIGTGRLTSKSDVYAFGVVLLEVLSGRPATRLLVAEEQSLVVWAQENISNGKADQIVVSNLKGKISEDCLKTFVEIAERCLHNEPKKRPTMAQVVLQLELALELQESSTSLVPNGITTDVELTTSSSNHEVLLRQENPVGFDDEAKKLIGYLTEETQQLDIISIVGMPGLGKTTLAQKVFNDPTIRYEFPIRIWVYGPDMREEVYYTILRSMACYRYRFGSTTEQLAQLVANNLQNKKFLIVFDNVLTTKVWDELLISLPNSKKTSKVLITTRYMEVALHANKNRDPHKLRFLTAEESWLLLRLEAFGKTEYPPEMEVYGKLIAEQCDGLPLAIKIIGGILAKKFLASDGMNSRKESWSKVYNQVNTYPNDNLERRLEMIILLSYNKLPLHLKSCFLYLAMFPVGFEIPVSKLSQMWIAEGFILQQSGMNLEEIAEKYLEDLIKRNLIKVGKIQVRGKVKTCYIDGMLWDFCKFQAGYERENFLQELEQSSVGVFQPPVSDRLCLYSGNVVSFYRFSFYHFKARGPRVCSFVCYSKGYSLPLISESSSVILSAFKGLRVLDIKPTVFIDKIPNDLYQLVHLSYLVLSIDFAVLPASFSKLCNLQTLIVYTQCRTLEIKADIWKLIHLRHLVTNEPITLPKTSKSSKEIETLQTLSTLSPKSCTKEVFKRAPNLKKLGIRGRLSPLLDGKTASFDNLGRLSNLEKLKLLNDVFPIWPAEDRLPRLPPAYAFPPNLRSLTLADTFLDWSQMSILGLLQNLEVLKLKDNAFMGASWIASDGGFRNLEVLQIGLTDLVDWEASGHHFPQLRMLELQNCEDLREVPIGLFDIPSLELLKLSYTPGAAASAKRILEAKEKKQEGEQTTSITQLKLTIFPQLKWSLHT